MELFNRHTRGMVACEIDGDTKGMERHAKRMEDAANREAEWQQAREYGLRGDTRAGMYTVENTATMSDREIRSLVRDNVWDPQTQDDLQRVLEWRARQEEPADVVVERELEDQHVWGTSPSWTISMDPGQTLSRSPMRKLNAQQRAKEDYQVYVYNQFLRAESETNGNLVNAKGRSRNVDPLELFSGDPRMAANYASDELKTWFRHNGHFSFKAFRHQVLGWESDRAAAERSKIFTGFDDAA